MKLKLQLFVLLIVIFVDGKTAVAADLAIDTLLLQFNQAVQTENKILQCQYSYNLASNFRFKGDVDQSKKYAEIAFKLANEIHDTTRIINALNILAVNLQQQGNLNDAVEKYNAAIEIAEIYSDTILLANSIENLGNIYGASGKTDFPKAIELLLKSARLKESVKAWNMLPGTYQSISSVFREMGDTLNRENYLLKAIDLVDRGLISNNSFIASVYNEAGRFYTEEKRDYQLAETYFGKVLAISQRLQWKKGMAVSLSNIANIKEKQENYSEALVLHNQALKLKQEMNDLYGQAITYHSVGVVHYHLKHYHEAVQMLEQSVKIAGENNFTSALKDGYQTLYKVYREMNLFKDALYNLEKYKVLADSISGDTHRKTIAELQTVYETAKKEQEIVNLTTENKVNQLKARQRSLVALILAILLLTILLSAFFIIRQNRLKNRQNEILLNQKLLRAQMNPHFIFNALGSIQNFILNNEVTDAAKYLARFAKLMRNILESSLNEKIPVEREIEIITNYLTLQQIRDNNNFQFEIASEGALPTDCIPPMLVQPFIENSIKHAFDKTITDAKISVKYKFSATDILIEVEDNGHGINQEAKPENNEEKSRAIELTRQRLNLLKKNSKEKGNITINDLKETGSRGTRVTINLKRV
ncbi:MAG: tetratricopeptide repeat protein [Draconibacterium sp.]|jgi:LytS/YehU family sensor histidine kinase